MTKDTPMGTPTEAQRLAHQDMRCRACGGLGTQPSPDGPDEPCEACDGLGTDGEVG